MKKKYGWTVYGIIGFIFTPIGLFFTILGPALGLSDSIRWSGRKDPMVFVSVFGGVGGIFLILGLVFLFIDLRRRYLLRRAYDSGNCVDAKILGVTEQTNVNMMNGHPRMVEAAWTDPDGVVHVYRSRYLYTNVEKLLTAETVPVYIDRFNENVGFVDVDTVLPEIRVH